MSAEVIEMSNQDKDRNIAIESAIGQIEKGLRERFGNEIRYIWNEP